MGSGASSAQAKEKEEVAKWDGVVQEAAAAEDLAHALELLHSVPEDMRPKLADFACAAEDVVKRAHAGAVFPDGVAGALRASRDLGAAAPPESSSELSRRARDAAVAGDEGACGEALGLAAEFRIEPDLEELTQGLGVAQARMLRQQADALPSWRKVPSWRSALQTALNVKVAEAIQAATGEGKDATHAAISEAASAGADVGEALFEDAWVDVVHLATTLPEPADSLELLSAVPKSHRAQLSEDFARAAVAAAEQLPGTADAVHACHDLEVPVPPSLSSRLSSELASAVREGDAESVQAHLSCARRYSVDLDGGVVAGDASLGYASLSMLLDQVQSAGLQEAPWAHQARDAYSAAASRELVEAASGRDHGRAFEVAGEVEARGFELGWLPGIARAAPDLLGAAVAVQDSGEEGSGDVASQLVGVAVRCNGDVGELLAQQPEELRGTAEALLEPFVPTWQSSQNGDSTAPDDKWADYVADWVLDVEHTFQKWLRDARLRERASTTGRSGYGFRRCEVGVDGETGEPLPWTGGVKYSVDFMFMTCLEQEPEAPKGKVVPIRRHAGGAQTHPPAGEAHPWYTERVRKRDSSSDWLNNDFFFRAFSEVMGKAGHSISGGADDIFDFRFNQDFRGKEESEPAMRGGVAYREPVGWKKFAVKVRDKFDDGDNAWLRLDGSPGEWAIAYHGTDYSNLPGILSTGLHAGRRQAYAGHQDVRTGEKIGSGIYCTPHIDTALAYAPQNEFEGRQLHFAFQCRVRPEAIKRCHDEESRTSGAYWVVNDAGDIRPYAVLVKEHG